MDQREIGQIAMQATGVAKKGIMLKGGAVAALFFFLFLLLLGGISGPPSAQASTCEDAGPGTGAAAPDTDNSAPASGSVHEQQLANANVIDKAARKLHLSGKATLIGMMTAMQESTLQNLDHGHADSIGLFQQRPSQKWGTEAELKKPATAARYFFAGHGGNKGLIDIKGWQTRPPGDVAQDVQKSAHPELYAGHETAMRKLAKEAGINLGRKGSDEGAPEPKTDGAASGDVPSRCGASGPPKPGKGKDTFSDGKATWQLDNPRTVKQAIAWAYKHSGDNSTDSWRRACLAFVARVYGWNASGVNYAIDHYKVVPASMRHDGDRHPPPGALMYWTTGHRAGHVAVYLGHGKIASNDIKRNGYIDVVSADEIEHKWGAKYVGWTPPKFPRGT